MPDPIILGLDSTNHQSASGQTARVELMKQTFCAGGLPEHLTEKDVHSVASVLKVGHIIIHYQRIAHHTITRSI